MNASPDVKSVEQLLELRKENLLYANPEYQRGVVWTPAQQKRLVDSVMRGYPIPLVYLHHIKKTVAGINNEHFEVIDGIRCQNDSLSGCGSVKGLKLNLSFTRGYSCPLLLILRSANRSGGR